jgi:hypothetical protein
VAYLAVAHCLDLVRFFLGQCVAYLAVAHCLDLVRFVGTVCGLPCRFLLP